MVGRAFGAVMPGAMRVVVVMIVLMTVAVTVIVTVAVMAAVTVDMIVGHHRPPLSSSRGRAR